MDIQETAISETVETPEPEVSPVVLIRPISFWAEQIKECYDAIARNREYISEFEAEIEKTKAFIEAKAANQERLGEPKTEPAAEETVVLPF